MKGLYYYNDQPYIVIDANIEKRFIRYILQAQGEVGKSYLIISERKNPNKGASK